MKLPSQIREEELGLVEDGDAMFASVLWYESQRAAGQFKEYEGKHIAILGQQVIASAPGLDELSRQLDALGDSINQRRVVIKYVPSPDELMIYG